MRGYNWIALQPLAGGMAIGAIQASGNLPNVILSESKFNANNEQLIAYIRKKYKRYNYEESGTIYDLSHNFNDLDFVVSVPICSGLSLLNSSSNRGSCASQNQNMVQHADFTLGYLKPKVFIFENAPLLYTTNGQGVVDQLLEIANKYNYALTLYKTNTILHGIPQNRPRTFALFWQNNVCPVMEYENIPSNLVEYLEQIPKEATQQNLYYNVDILNTAEYLFCATKFKDVRFEFFDKCASSLMNLICKDNLLDEYIEWCDSFGYSSKIPIHVKKKMDMGKSYWDNSLCFAPKDYVGAVQGRMYGRMVHPTKNRDFNVRELIHLMGHPHDYEIQGGLKNLNMIAQNVPVATAKFIVGQAIKYINGKLMMSRATFLKQDNNKQKIDYNNNKNKDLMEFF